jgi:hypothetical protein
MARKPLTTTIDRSGPFFTNNPGKTFRQNARSMMRAIAIEGQTDVIAQLLVTQSGRDQISVASVQPRRVAGHVAAGVPYTPDRSKTGQIRANVYVPNFGMSKKEAQSLMAAYSRVEGETGAFKRTTTRLRQAKAVNRAELLKGLT